MLFEGYGKLTHQCDNVAPLDGENLVKIFPVRSRNPWHRASQLFFIKKGCFALCIASYIWAVSGGTLTSGSSGQFVPWPFVLAATLTQKSTPQIPAVPSVMCPSGFT